MRILITGVTGFLGTHLAKALKSAGHELYGTTRKNLEETDKINLIPFALGDPTENLNLKGIDCLLHLIHDFDSGSEQKNIEGTKALMNWASHCGVTRQIYFSSFSASPTAITQYGRIKYIVEQWSLRNNVMVVRPGLVIGPGGLCNKIYKFLMRSPIVPLLDGGKGLVPIISIRDLCSALLKITTMTAPKMEYNLFNNQLCTLAEIVKELSLASKRKHIFVSVPSSPVLGFLVACEKLGLNTSINSENVRGFLHNQLTSIQSNLLELIDSAQTLQQMCMSLANASGTDVA